MNQFDFHIATPPLHYGAPLYCDPLDQMAHELQCAPYPQMQDIGSREWLYREKLKLQDEVKALKARIRELGGTIAEIDKPTPLQGYEKGPRS